MKKKIGESIRWKTFLGLLVLLMASCVLIYGVVLVFLPKNYHAALESQVTDDFYTLAEDIEQTGWQAQTQALLAFTLQNNAAVWIADGAGREVFSVQSVSAAETGQDAEAAPVLSCVSTFQEDGQTYQLFAQAALVAVSQSYGILLRLLPLVAGIILAVSVVGAALCARYYAQPLVTISDAARRMTALDMTWKCEVNRRDEIGVLAASLNEMSARLRHAMDDLTAANRQLTKEIEREREQETQRVEFFTAVSHELKTPLAILKGQLEGMIYQVGAYKDRDAYLRRCLQTANEMESLVKEILSAARMGGSGFHLERTELDLGQLLRKACQQFQGQMADKQLALHLDIRPAAPFLGDRRLMEKVCTNLVGNAVAYSPAGAAVTVVCKDGMFSVENTGVHLAPADLQRIFTPFYRVDKSRSRNSGGSGLGLYITKTILDHHAIRYSMANTENGVRFTAFLP